MYAHRIIFISLCLLLSLYGQGQSQSVTDSAGIYSKDTVAHQTREEFDIQGKKVINDSTVAFGADKVVPGKDSIPPVVKKHSPVKAVWMSAILPGLGQAYNKKYWKIPIIYAGLGGLGYWIYFENKEFGIARASYRAAVRNTATGTAMYKGVEASYSTIKPYRDYYKNLLNYAAIVTALWYTLNLVDAAVDGHLYHFNVDEKLSMNVDPSFVLPAQLGMSQACFGLSLSFSPMASKKRYTPAASWQ